MQKAQEEGIFRFQAEMKRLMLQQRQKQGTAQ